MTEPVIIALILSGVAFLLGVFILLTKANEETKLIELKEKFDALADWQEMYSKKIQTLQAEFTELVYRQDRELWKKLGLTEPAGYEQQKPDVHLMFENGLENTFKDLAEKLNTIEKEHLSKAGIEVEIKVDPEAMRPKYYPEDAPIKGYDRSMEPSMVAIFEDIIRGNQRGSENWIRLVRHHLGKLSEFPLCQDKKMEIHRGLHYCSTLLNQAHATT